MEFAPKKWRIFIENELFSTNVQIEPINAIITKVILINQTEIAFEALQEKMFFRRTSKCESMRKFWAKKWSLLSKCSEIAYVENYETIFELGNFVCISFLMPIGFLNFF